MMRYHGLRGGAGMLVVAVAVVATAPGCSRQQSRDGFTEVTGMVTLDGEPLSNAQLLFESPKGISYGRTDSKGRYEAEYSRQNRGVGVGPVIVRISTSVIFPDEDPSMLEVDTRTGEYQRKELVPARYNRQSELTIDVQPGSGPYDFELTSDM